MGKYNEQYLTSTELGEIARLIETLSEFPFDATNVDHVQVGDINGEIVGKVQYFNNQWVFMPRKHDKPGTLGE